MNKIDIDIEAFSSVELHPYQKDMWSRLSTGFKQGELCVMMSGRQTGKSMLSSVAFKRLLDDLYKEQPIRDLVLSEGRVHGAVYHCVQPEGGSWTKMEEWCRETFGEPGDMWESNDWCWPETARWLQNNRKFWFRHEKDRDWFLIRWNA